MRESRRKLSSAAFRARRRARALPRGRWRGRPEDEHAFDLGAFFVPPPIATELRGARPRAAADEIGSRYDHAVGLLELQKAVREGEVMPAVAAMLDRLEARGALGVGEQIVQLRSRITQVGKLRAAIWKQHPEVVPLDLYARTLDAPELDSIREQWDVELDAAGPWLRPLRAWRSSACVVAEVLASAQLPLDQPAGVRFEGEDAVVLGAHGAKTMLWMWTRGLVEAGCVVPAPPRDFADARLESGKNSPRYRTSSEDEFRDLPWPEFGHPSAQLSDDGQTIYVFGWYGDYDGLLLLVDARSLEIRDRVEFARPVFQVLERPGSDELLVATYGELVILGAGGRRWQRLGSASGVAWSSSGRYVCIVGEHRAEIVDTHTLDDAGNGEAGIPPSFSPDGARLVDGASVFDGRTGKRLARLGLTQSHYLAGGPPSPWWHVGTELIVSIYSVLTGAQVWDARDGSPIATRARVCFTNREAVAFTRSGRRFVAGHGHRVQIGSLPDGETVATVEFSLRAEALALSDSGELVAAYGGGHVEVRSLSGALVGRAALPVSRAAEPWPLGSGSFEISADIQHLTLAIPEETRHGASRERGSYTEFRPRVACRWALDGDPLTLLDPALAFPTPLPPGWSVVDGALSRFEHVDGARITVPLAGPWVANPVAPTIVACPGGVFELRAHPNWKIGTPSA